MPVATKSIKVKTEPAPTGPMVCHTPADHLQTPVTTSCPHTSCNALLNLLGSITCSLDPNLHAACHDEQSAHSLKTTHLLSLGNQLCDSRAAINNLCNHLALLDHEYNDAKHCANHTEVPLKMERRMAQGQRLYPTLPWDHYYHMETRYRSGGGSTPWVDPDDHIDYEDPDIILWYIISHSPSPHHRQSPSFS